MQIYLVMDMHIQSWTDSPRFFPNLTLNSMCMSNFFLKHLRVLSSGAFHTHIPTIVLAEIYIFLEIKALIWTTCGWLQKSFLPFSSVWSCCNLSISIKSTYIMTPSFILVPTLRELSWSIVLHPHHSLKFNLCVWVTYHWQGYSIILG